MRGGRDFIVYRVVWGGIEGKGVVFYRIECLVERSIRLIYLLFFFSLFWWKFRKEVVLSGRIFSEEV